MGHQTDRSSWVRVCVVFSSVVTCLSGAGYAASIDVLTPNGGESWLGGTSYAITWTSTELDGDVGLYLYTNWTKLRELARVPASDGSWTWNISPNEVSSTTYRIRVCSKTDSAISDYSDTVFSIGPERAIDLLSPDGGERLVPGQDWRISWSSTGDLQNVNIYLYNNWTKLRKLASVRVNDGEWTWPVPMDEVQGMAYRIRLEVAGTEITDYSEGKFAILEDLPTLQIISPNGGETWKRGETQVIQWTSSVLTGNVSIYLYSGWTKLRLLATAPAGSEVATLWPIAATEPVGTNYRIRVQSQENGAITDYSDAVFAIGDTGGQTMLLPGNVPLHMMWIPAGSFQMGRYAGEQDSYSDEAPRHPVTFMSGFWLGKYEVTQAQWLALMGSNPSHFTGDLSRPVEMVSWNGIQAFVMALNQYTGLTFRLPSEAEWEYAARAGATGRFYWGDDPSYTQIGLYAWYLNNAIAITHPVGQKPPNAWGLYDMSGNVWEFCQDWYHSSYVGAPANGSAWVVPTGAYRVRRGGGWDNPGDFHRSANRDGSGAGSIGDAVGLRLAR